MAIIRNHRRDSFFVCKACLLVLLHVIIVAVIVAAIGGKSTTLAAFSGAHRRFDFSRQQEQQQQHHLYKNNNNGAIFGQSRQPTPETNPRQCRMLLQESPSENNREDTNPEEEEEDDDSDSQLFRGIQPQGEADDDDDDEQKLMLDELAWRTHKVLLEEQNEKRFQKALRSKPLKLSYRQAKKWVQANLGAETQEEFEDLVLNGNLRTPYVPKDPKRYYTDVGTWLGWEDFLLGKPT